MPRIELPATEKTPSLLFDPDAGLLELRGCSIHENAHAFFRPLLEEVKAYAASPAASTTVKFAMTYFNSSSSKYMLDLLRLLDEARTAGSGDVTLEWYFDEDDLDMEEAGEDYKILLEMPVSLVCQPRSS